MFGIDHILYDGAYTYADAVNAFFLYSFCGWVMECIVIRREKGVWENRGFVHLPLCIIYGFGAMAGYALLRPMTNSYLLIYVSGALLATAFEYLTGRLMLRLFGQLWWDYSNKRFNYRGILCLESTIGWGLIAVLIFAVIHPLIFGVVTRLDHRSASTLAIILFLAYLLDFICSARTALHKAHDNREEHVCDPS